MESRPSRASDILLQRAEEEQILLDPRNGQYYALDEVGARIWELADGSRAISEIVETLAREYDAPREEIEADALALLGELKQEKLVETSA